MLLASHYHVFSNCSLTGVSVALRYWAGSYDDKQAESLGTLAVAAAHHSLNRWRQVPNHLVSFVHSSSSDAMVLDEPNAVHSSDYWLKLYCILAVANLALYGGRVAFFLYRGVVASRVIYTDLIANILGARSRSSRLGGVVRRFDKELTPHVTVRFFDSTPTGRILNRLSKDIETIDQDVASW